MVEKNAGIYLFNRKNMTSLRELCSFFGVFMFKFKAPDPIFEKNANTDLFIQEVILSDFIARG